MVWQYVVIVIDIKWQWFGYILLIGRRVRLNDTTKYLHVYFTASVTRCTQPKTLVYRPTNAVFLIFQKVCYNSVRNIHFIFAASCSMFGDKFEHATRIIKQM